MSHVRTSSTSSTIRSAPRSSFSSQHPFPFPQSTSFSQHRAAAASIELRPVPTRNGSSTPFPITPIKFEYPVSASTMPTSPVRPSTETERRVFAEGLSKALGKLKPSKVFAVNVNLKTPPSLVGKRRYAARVPSPSFSTNTSASSSLNWDSSSSSASLGGVASGLRTPGSRATITGANYRY